MRRPRIEILCVVWMIAMFGLIGSLPNVPEPLFWLMLLSLFVPAIYSISGGLIEGYREGEKDLRKREHRCLVCGYALIGNKSGICPECGTPSKR